MFFKYLPKELRLLILSKLSNVKDLNRALQVEKAMNELKNYKFIEDKFRSEKRFAIYKQQIENFIKKINKNAKEISMANILIFGKNAENEFYKKIGCNQKFSEKEERFMLIKTESYQFNLWHMPIKNNSNLNIYLKTADLVVLCPENQQELVDLLQMIKEFLFKDNFIPFILNNVKIKLDLTIANSICFDISLEKISCMNSNSINYDPFAMNRVIDLFIGKLNSPVETDDFDEAGLLIHNSKY